jgi:hypothetical protein
MTVRPAAAAFFEGGPAFGLTGSNGRFVALAGAFDGFLDAPAEAAQETADMGGMIADAEFAGDHLRHAGGGPGGARVAERFGATLQQADNLVALPLVQALRPTRWPAVVQGSAGGRSSPLHPLAHCAHRYPSALTMRRWLQPS